MNRKPTGKTALITFLILGLFTTGCKFNSTKIEKKSDDSLAYNLGVVGGFSELINAGVKQLALSAPMTKKEMDEFVTEAEKIAKQYQVQIYREKNLITTDLFSHDLTRNKEVLLLYQGTTLEAYFTLKEDKRKLEKTGKYKSQNKLDIARRFGRMLSYSPRKINQLLAQNSDFRTMADFDIQASNLFLYYKDLKKASDFYANVLGMELVADYTMASIFRMAENSYLILVDAEKGMHSAEEPKTVALALLTDQLDQWYAFLKKQKVPIKYEYKPKEASAHDGFVAIDPEGYLLEFERFNQHPENERFIPVLNQNETITGPNSSTRKTPAGLGFQATITWLYHKDLLNMQDFYQDILGLEMVADQGWAKIYKVTNTGFIGLVDEKRGMHQFTEKKAVNVSFILKDLEGWHNYALKHQPFPLRSDQLETGPENKYKAFTGFDPEAYYLEFDQFFPHKDNELLLKYLTAE